MTHSKGELLPPYVLKLKLSFSSWTVTYGLKALLSEPSAFETGRPSCWLIIGVVKTSPCFKEENVWFGLFA